MTGHAQDPHCRAHGIAPARLGIAAGISDFARIRREGRYYVDKTRGIAALLEDDCGPLLLTRPRRFGKTLTMDTLRCFLELDYREPGRTSLQEELFAGLEIAEDPDLRACRERFMGQHPVVALSFSTVEGENFTQALTALRGVVHALFSGFEALLQTAGLSAADHAVIEAYLNIRVMDDQQRLMSMIRDAAVTMVELLCRIYSRPVCVLIDEYDTPLARAWGAEQHPLPGAEPAGYYSRMAALMRGIIHPLLKPPPALQDSIERCLCTGCTRVSRESLFSGANNLTVLGLDHRPTAALMGFTAEEVQALLAYYGLEGRMPEVEEWYDGYRLAGVRIYNPWSIASFCRAALDTPGCGPVSYWAHAGRNDELSHCLHAMPGSGLERLRQLSAGEQVALPVRQAFSYDELLCTPDQGALFTLLWHTGYVTQGDDGAADCAAGEQVMRIPNAEVRECFEQQILGLYDFRAEAEAGGSSALVTALLEGMAGDAHRALNELLGRYLSFHGHVMRSSLAGRIARLLEDQAAELAEGFAALDDRRPERVYQLYVMGVLSGHAGRGLRELVMERELGAGRADLSFISAPGRQSGCVLEFKRAAPGGGSGEREQAAAAGLRQIEDRDYARGLLLLYPCLREVHAYGIGCAGRRCAVAWRRYERGELQP